MPVFVVLGLQTLRFGLEFRGLGFRGLGFRDASFFLVLGLCLRRFSEEMKHHAQQPYPQTVAGGISAQENPVACIRLGVLGV